MVVAMFKSFEKQTGRPLPLALEKLGDGHEIITFDVKGQGARRKAQGIGRLTNGGFPD
jgi:hypothetical protein